MTLHVIPMGKNLVYGSLLGIYSKILEFFLSVIYYRNLVQSEQNHISFFCIKGVNSQGIVFGLSSFMQQDFEA